LFIFFGGKVFIWIYGVKAIAKIRANFSISMAEIDK